MSEEGRTVRLKVEGRLVGDWVSELEEACGSCLSQKKTLILDLSDLTFIDRRGVHVLRTVLEKRGQVVKPSLLVQALLGCESAGGVRGEAGG